MAQFYDECIVSKQEGMFCVALRPPSMICNRPSEFLITVIVDD